jgi:hypothetical protein
MGQESKVIYDRRSEDDRRDSDEPVAEEQRVFGDRRKTEGLELSTDAIDDDEFEEVFKQFQKADPETGIIDPNQAAQNLEIIDYQVLYREGVECAYITLLKTNEDDNEPTLYAFREENENADSELERAPMHVQNIFGSDAYESYVKQGWSDISKTENEFPWALKAWLAQNMKQDEIKSR